MDGTYQLPGLPQSNPLIINPGSGIYILPREFTTKTAIGARHPGPYYSTPQHEHVYVTCRHSFALGTWVVFVCFCPAFRGSFPVSCNLSCCALVVSD